VSVCLCCTVDHIQSIVAIEKPLSIAYVLPIPRSVGDSSSGGSGLRFYATATGSIRLIDSATAKLQILCGSVTDCDGFADGDSTAARFYYPNGLALSADEKTLYVCDERNHRIRAVDTMNGHTRTVAGSGSRQNVNGIGVTASIGRPKHCDWDRASDIEADTYLYITAYNALRRLNVKTGETTTLKCSVNINPFGIVCLPRSGIVVLSCIQTLCLWTIDPRANNKMERLAGAGRVWDTGAFETATEWEDPFSIHFRSAFSIALHERDQSILVADRTAHRIVRVPLPDSVRTASVVSVTPAGLSIRDWCVVA
jgi:hypothetical protein